MIARLDAALPPLDPALGFYLLLAACAGYGIARILDRARREPAADPHRYAEAHGDVTRRPEAR
jgi:hypothetical protein